MKTKIVSALFFWSAAMAIYAQAPDRAKLDAYMTALESNKKFMGSVAVSKDGRTVYEKSVGYLDTEKKTRLTADSKFRIGSISKTFTAALIFKAIEEKKLSLDTKLDKYFSMVPNASEITLAHLLAHRSGIHNFTNDESFTTWNTSPQTQARMLDVIVKGGSDFKPGSRAVYSNSNYVLLTYILEKIYQKNYGELVDKTIIKPLGLKNTYYGGKINNAANEANSYTFKDTWVKESETDMSIPAGAGAMVSTPADLSRFIEGLFAGKIVTEASLKQMTTIVDDHGMGLFKFPFNDKVAYGHNGAIDGFSSVVLYLPEEKVVFALTSNGSNYNEDNIAIAALSWIFNEPFDVPEFMTYKTEELDKYLGVYSSSQMPLKITITKNNTTLIAQATGQSSFPLDAASLNTFKFDMAGIVMKFDPVQKKMILQQGGASYSFTKE